MARFLEALKKNPYVYILGTETKRVLGRLSREARHRRWKRDRTARIREYLAAGGSPKLHVGCGPMLLEGWINSDMEPDLANGVIYLDVTEPLPFPDASLQLLADLLTRAGFDPVVSCELQESRHADLANMEHHGTAIGDSCNRLQTMVLEATRPARMRPDP